MDYSLEQRLSDLRGPILLTGHTGFKGTWMTYLLEHLKVPVAGYSLKPEKDSLFERLGRQGLIPEKFADIRDFEAFKEFISVHRPSLIIHMAAQPLVLKSYERPRETFDVNVMGTANVLDAAFESDFVKKIIVVTSDKVYLNANSGKRFKESDPLAGKDPYSASKVGAESVVAAWQQIANVKSGPKVISVRAGNVIGGGDWATDRLIPDIIRAVLTSSALSVRNPESVRPWQHVLDPLFGYLLVAVSYETSEEFKSFNFGPSGNNVTVKEVVEISKKHFGTKLAVVYEENKNGVTSKVESLTLNLDSTSSSTLLKFRPKWDQQEAIERTFLWWKKFLYEKATPEDLIIEEIKDYFSKN
jgi:CDP-glucose 4,6-dehydratase